MAIGTAAAMLGASAIGAAATSSAASKAAKAQTAAANNDIAFQRETRDMTIARLDPFYQPGVTAQNALAFEMGLADRPMIGAVAPTITPTIDRRGRVTGYGVGGQTFKTEAEAQAYANANKTGGTAYRGFQATPGYQFQFEQGTAAVNALAGAKGGLNSGRTLQDLTKFGQGIANQEYGNYLSRLGGMSASGQNAANSQGTAAQNAAAAVSNAYGNIGNAQAAGAIAQGNAISGFTGNALGILAYQQGLTHPVTASYGGGR